jgi:hypothetical protein
MEAFVVRIVSDNPQGNLLLENLFSKMLLQAGGTSVESYTLH